MSIISIISIVSIISIISTQVRSVSTGSSRGSAQLEVKLPWYMGITCKVGSVGTSVRVRGGQ